MVTGILCEYCGHGMCDCQERICCTQKGTVGHMLCGWCEAHKGPEFLCMCSVKKWASTPSIKEDKK